LAVTDWRLRRWRLWFLALMTATRYGLALAALALMVFGAIDCPPQFCTWFNMTSSLISRTMVNFRRFMILFSSFSSGLQIVFSLDEVAFIQNLVFYIESAYCVPVSNE